MKALIFRILSILLNIVSKLLSDEELTKLLESIIKSDLNGDGIIGNEGSKLEKSNFQEKTQDSNNTNTATNASDNINTTNNIDSVKNNLNNLKRDVNIKLGGGLL